MKRWEKVGLSSFAVAREYDMQQYLLAFLLNFRRRKLTFVNSGHIAQWGKICQNYKEFSMLKMSLNGEKMLKMAEKRQF